MKEKILLFILLLSSSLLGRAQTTVEVTAGGLSAALGSGASTISDLTVTGTIDARDFLTMRDAMDSLTSLDLSGASIAAYSGTEGTYSGTETTYAANVIPDYSFCTTDLTGKTSMVSVILPTSITSIGFHAFAYCNGLTSIEIPEGVTSLSNKVFYNCTALETVELPNSLNDIGAHVFRLCTALKTITIPNSVTEFDTGLFCKCTKLASINIPDSLVKIKGDVFQDCSSLTSIDLPNSVIRVDEGTFEGCTSLDTLTSPEMFSSSSFPSTVSNITLTDTIDATDFKILRDDMASLTTLDLENATIAAYSGTGGTWSDEEIDYLANEVPGRAFSYSDETGKTSLESVILPTSTTIISNRAFCNCTGLTQFKVPDGATIIVYGAFQYCSSLESVELPGSLLYVGQRAFRGCTGLKNINIPSSVGSLDAQVFLGCTALDTVTSPEMFTSTTFPSTVSNITLTDTIDATDFKILRDDMASLTTLDLENATIAAYSGTEGTINGIDTSYAANEVPHFSFCATDYVTGKTSLESVILPTSTKEIGQWVFNACTGLTYVEIPEGVTTINLRVFSACTSLETVKLPDSLRFLDRNSFREASALKTITIPNLVDSLPKNIFYNCTSLSSIKLPDSLRFLGLGLLYNCSALTSITIPASVTAIGSSAFYGCTSLDSIYAENPAPVDFEASGSEDVFEGVDTLSCILFVAEGSAAAYSVADQWEDFNNIYETMIWEGSGTESDPFQIADLEDLKKLSDRNYTYYWDKYFIQTADIDADSTRYWDISDGDTLGFLPIGYYGIRFTGSYNGKGHAIKGLYVNRPSTNAIGLFGYLGEGSAIDSVGLRDCNIAGYRRVGALAGVSYISTLSNCYVSGEVSSYCEDAYHGTGGLIGLSDQSTVSGCCSTVDVWGTYMVGGLIGNSVGSTISNCYSAGKVTSSGDYGAGGLVGYNNSATTVSGCYSTSDVVGISMIGGLVGCNYYSSQINNCYASGTVSGTATVGGLVGTNWGGEVTNSYAVGEVYCSSGTGVGGLVGGNEYTITSSYFNSETCGEAAAASSMGTALTTSQMKVAGNFANWDFSGTWGILGGQTYPALASVSNNAPFAFADTIATRGGGKLGIDTLSSPLLANDYDYETGQTNLTVKIDSVTAHYGTYSEGIYTADFTLATEDALDTIKYVVGEVISGDTLWGNSAYAAIKAQLFDGSGTESDPYQIATLEDLTNLSAYSDYWDKYYVQTVDIDASATAEGTYGEGDGSGFSPIGNNDTKFTGHYNGKGHAIKGLYINRSSTGYVGLFGYSSGATIDSVGIRGCNISGSGDVGCLVGYSTSSTISNSYSTGEVSGSGNFVGGMFGRSISSTTISNCYSTCDISGANRVGGLVGINAGTIDNCYATGEVLCSGDYAGGLVALDAGSISNSYASGAVSCSGDFVGGLVGAGYSLPTNCYYNLETCGEAAADSEYGTALTTSEMKTEASFYGWDFTGTWGIREGQTYPALDSVSNNAPFAFADTINSSSVEFSALLANDYDYEAAQANLVAAVVDSGNCVVSGTSITLPEGTETGDTIEVSYKVGELLSSGDTLWGNVATALLVKTSSVQIWAGTGTWGETAYWSTGTLPGSADSVIVESGILTLGQDATIGSLTVEAGASLEVTVGYTLTVSGDLTIEGDASGTGCIVNKGTLAVGGTSYVQQYMTGNKWHIVSPNATTGSISAFMQEAGNDIPTFVDNDTTFYGIVEYEEGINDWSDYFITATTDVFEACKGYMLYRGSDGVVTFSGSLYSGNQSIALTKDGAGWNCVGNPYTSAIDINYDATTSFLAANADGLDENYGAIYLWVEGEGYDGTVSQYKVISNASFEFGSDRTLSDNFVAPGQAFMVKAASGTSVASFTPDMQTTGSYLLKSAKAAWPAFRLDLTSGSSTASTVVAFNGSMTNGLDKTYDAGVMGNPGALEISSRLVGGDKGIGFAIQCLPGDYENLVIPVDVYSEDGGEISISAETASLPSACKVILEDKSTGTYTELTDGESYSATVVAGEAETGRFYIHTGMNTTGTEGLELDGGESFNVYLSGGEIVIEGNVGNSATASLYSITGKRASINKLQAGSRNCIQSQGLAPGVYLLTVTDGGNRYSTKIVIL